MHKKLIMTVIIMLIAGMSFLAGIFASSMMPTMQAENRSAHIDISKLKKGHFLLEKFGQTRIYILDTTTGLKVYMVPYYNSSFVMPDLAWFRWGGFCKNFGPETDNGILKTNGVFKCHDNSDYEWGKKEWVWDFEGMNKGEYTEDMYKPKYIIRNNNLVLLGMQK